MLRGLVFLAVMPLLLAVQTNVGSAGPSPKDRRQNLIAVYLVSIAADRCGFTINRKEADAIDRAANYLENQLGMSSVDADALYSDVDIKVEKLGDRACDPTGEVAQSMRTTLSNLTK